MKFEILMNYHGLSCNVTRLLKNEGVPNLLRLAALSDYSFRRPA